MKLSWTGGVGEEREYIEQEKGIESVVKKPNQEKTSILGFFQSHVGLDEKK